MSNYHFAMIVEKYQQGYFAYCPELQGCYTQGDTFEEVVENIKDANLSREEFKNLLVE